MTKNRVLDNLVHERDVLHKRILSLKEFLRKAPTVGDLTLVEWGLLEDQLGFMLKYEEVLIKRCDLHLHLSGGKKA